MNVRCIHFVNTYVQSDFTRMLMLMEIEKTLLGSKYASRYSLGSDGFRCSLNTRCSACLCGSCKDARGQGNPTPPQQCCPNCTCTRCQNIVYMLSKIYAKPLHRISREERLDKTFLFWSRLVTFKQLLTSFNL
jgi:hypothetical protein